MKEYDVLEGKNYPELYSFLNENGLEIRSSFNATDLDCAFHVCKKNHSLGDKLTKNDFYVCFFHYAYERPMFSWSLTNKICMNEKQFVGVLKEILKSDNKYISFNQTPIYANPNN